MRSDLPSCTCLPTRGGQKLAGILEKVFATTGESVKAGLVQVPMNPEGIRPFQKLLGSFDKNSFWRIELKGNYENMLTKGPLKTGIDKLLLGLEGLALIYSVKDQFVQVYSIKESVTRGLNAHSDDRRNASRQTFRIGRGVKKTNDIAAEL